MVFDQDYVLIDPTAGGYDFYAPVREAADTETQNISLEIDIPENAKYIYTYVANESAGTHVFFDDFTVAQLGVDITETTDYYPFGSIMSHWQKEDYRFGYQGEYAEEDEETGFNHFEARAFDNKTGRWMTVDPARAGYSPYWGMDNNPIYYIDRDGRCPKCPDPLEDSNFFSGGQTYSPEGSDATYLLTDPSLGRDGWIRISDPMLSEVVITPSFTDHVSDISLSTAALTLNMAQKGINGLINIPRDVSNTFTYLPTALTMPFIDLAGGGNLDWTGIYYFNSNWQWTRKPLDNGEITMQDMKQNAHYTINFLLMAVPGPKLTQRVPGATSTEIFWGDMLIKQSYSTPIKKVRDISIDFHD